jgi:hypothetical protein
MKVHCYGVTDLQLGAESYFKNNSSSADEVIPTILTGLKVHLRFHNSTPLDPVLTQMNPAHTLKVYFLKMFLLLSTL